MEGVAPLRKRRIHIEWPRQTRPSPIIVGNDARKGDIDLIQYLVWKQEDLS
jgi:hypothetical protein